MMNEEELFNKLKEKLIPDLEKRNPKSYRDGYSPSHNLSVELKCRRSNYEHLIIEKMKWDKLIIEPNVRYVNSMPRGIYSFDLKSIPEPNWFDKMLPAETDFDRKEKITKKVGLLDVRLAKNITNLL
jgi:hypothetical protein